MNGTKSRRSVPKVCPIFPTWSLSHGRVSFQVLPCFTPHRMKSGSLHRAAHRRQYFAAVGAIMRFCPTQINLTALKSLFYYQACPCNFFSCKTFQRLFNFSLHNIPCGKDLNAQRCLNKFPPAVIRYSVVTIRHTHSITASFLLERGEAWKPCDESWV